MKISIRNIMAIAVCAAVLSGCGQTAAQVTAAAAAETDGIFSENRENVYRVLVVDQLGEPVSGAAIQFCNDTECLFGTTDTNASAAFETDEGQGYEAHLFKAPEQYEDDEIVYPVPEKYGTVKIVAQTKNEAVTAENPDSEPYELSLYESGVIFKASGAYRDTRGFLYPSMYGLLTEQEPYVWVTFCLIGHTIKVPLTMLWIISITNISRQRETDLGYLIPRRLSGRTGRTGSIVTGIFAPCLP